MAYDSIKDNVKSSGSEDSSGTPEFETLKKEAQENTAEEDGDNTPIEVLEEGLEDRSKAGSQDKERNTKPQKSRNTASRGSGDVSGAGEVEGIERKLDRLIEQNKRMIEILEGFGN